MKNMLLLTNKLPCEVDPRQVTPLQSTQQTLQGPHTPATRLKSGQLDWYAIRKYLLWQASKISSVTS